MRDGDGCVLGDDRILQRADQVAAQGDDVIGGCAHLGQKSEHRDQVAGLQFRRSSEAPDHGAQIGQVHVGSLSIHVDTQREVYRRRLEWGAELLAARYGIDVALPGGGFSRANGYPDIGLLTMSEILGWIGRCVDAVDIPVISDMDTGYGNALNVVRSVREFERTGVAAFHLEDQVAPKKCGHYEGKAVVTAGSRESMEVDVSKLHAAGLWATMQQDR